MADEQATPKKVLRGFAAMSPEKRREVSGKGGKSAHAQGLAHQWTSEEASEAGKKGSKTAHAQGTAYRWTKETAGEAGKKGGIVSNQRKKEKQ